MRLLRTALLPLVLVVVAACGADPRPVETRPATADSSLPTTLSFTGTTLDGKSFDGASLAGRPSVLWFWAPWCATCFGQAATVSAEADEFAGRVNFLGVAGLGGAREMAEFVAEGEVGNVTHLNDERGAVWRKFGITEQSQFVMLDQTGKVVQKGYLDSVTLDQWVRYIAK